MALLPLQVHLLLQCPPEDLVAHHRLPDYLVGPLHHLEYLVAPLRLPVGEVGPLHLVEEAGLLVWAQTQLQYGSHL